MPFLPPALVRVCLGHETRPQVSMRSIIIRYFAFKFIVQLHIRASRVKDEGADDIQGYVEEQVLQVWLNCPNTEIAIEELCKSSRQSNVQQCNKLFV